MEAIRREMKLENLAQVFGGFEWLTNPYDRKERERIDREKREKREREDLRRRIAENEERVAREQERIEAVLREYNRQHREEIQAALNGL